MSLRAVHILFITCSILLAFGFSFWCYESYQFEPQVQYLLYGVPSLLVGLGLIGYGQWFLKKVLVVGENA